MLTDIKEYIEGYDLYRGMTEEEIRKDLENYSTDELKCACKIMSIKLYTQSRVKILENMSSRIYARNHKGDAFRY